MHFVYILFSEKSDRYYVGETVEIDQRLLKHNQHFYKGASTVIADDWKVVWQIECETIHQARKIERFIKKMKSREFLSRLIQTDGKWLKEKVKEK